MDAINSGEFNANDLNRNSEMFLQCRRQFKGNYLISQISNEPTTGGVKQAVIIGLG